MARPRSSIAELERMIRVIEPGANNLGQYLANHSEELARRLEVDAEKFTPLVALPDEEIAPLLAQLLEHRASERAGHHQAATQEIALAAAQRLGATAVWANDIASLDVPLLLGKLLLDTSRSYITLDAAGPCGEFQVNLPRILLVNVAKDLGQRPDLLAWVDGAGLHLRWNGGRGGLNFISQCVPASEAASVLTVNIPPPVMASLRALAPRSRWFSDVLSEVALA